MGADLVIDRPSLPRRREVSSDRHDRRIRANPEEAFDLALGRC
jgi:hypothetical protein